MFFVLQRRKLKAFLKGKPIRCLLSRDIIFCETFTNIEKLPKTAFMRLLAQSVEYLLRKISDNCRHIWAFSVCLEIGNISWWRYLKHTCSKQAKQQKMFFTVPRQSVLRKASICSCPTPLAPFWPNSRWESSRCKTSMAISWKPPSWFPPRSASTYDRRRSGSFCFTNCAAEKKT